MLINATPPMEPPKMAPSGGLYPGPGGDCAEEEVRLSWRSWKKTRIYLLIRQGTWDLLSRCHVYRRNITALFRSLFLRVYWRCGLNA